MIRFFFILVLAAFAAVVMQHFIPPVSFLSGARVMILPLIFFYGALALPFPGMLALAFVCGLMTDALAGQEVALGWSVILYALMGALMSGFRPIFQEGRWEVHCLMSGVCTSLMTLITFLMISVRRLGLYNASMEFNADIWWRIGGAGLIALVLAPAVFFVFKSLAAFVGYNPYNVIDDEEDY